MLFSHLHQHGLDVNFPSPARQYGRAEDVRTAALSIPYHPAATVRRLARNNAGNNARRFRRDFANPA